MQKTINIFLFNPLFSSWCLETEIQTQEHEEINIVELMNRTKKLSEESGMKVKLEILSDELDIELIISSKK